MCNAKGDFLNPIAPLLQMSSCETQTDTISIFK